MHAKSVQQWGFVLCLRQAQPVDSGPKLRKRGAQRSPAFDVDSINMHGWSVHGWAHAQHDSIIHPKTGDGREKTSAAGLAGHKNLFITNICQTRMPSGQTQTETRRWQALLHDVSDGMGLIHISAIIRHEQMHKNSRIKGEV